MIFGGGIILFTIYIIIKNLIYLPIKNLINWIKNKYNTYISGPEYIDIGYKDKNEVIGGHDGYTDYTNTTNNINKKQQISYKSYYDYLLHTNEWYNKRNKILNRDNYRCRWCGNTRNLQVHHKYYNIYPNGNKANPWDYPDDALIVLCDDCHVKYHNKYSVKTYYRKFYKHYE